MGLKKNGQTYEPKKNCVTKKKKKKKKKKRKFQKESFFCKIHCYHYSMVVHKDIRTHSQLIVNTMQKFHLVVKCCCSKKVIYHY